MLLSGKIGQSVGRDPQMESKFPPTKGMIFAGCSFTWGQGLYYYSNLPSLREPKPDHYDVGLLRPAHYKFAESVRFPRVVANHFNSYEFVQSHNGGSNNSDISVWKRHFTHSSPGERIEYNEISHVIVQLTQWQRNNIQFSFQGAEYNIAYWELMTDGYRKMFLEWIEASGHNVKDWTNAYIQSGLDEVKEFMQTAENNGVKTIIFPWPDEYVPYIEKDSWLTERSMPMTYKGKSYKSMETLMMNKELVIKFDYENFKVPPQDHHPSLECHKIMANSIINYIESHP